MIDKRITSKLSEWFYHAPSKRTSKPAKQAPAASQIPGIGGLKDEFVNPEQDDRHFRRKWIRDTDSKYIKLAKKGGRKNLLAFSSPPSKPEEPVPYPRVDWFDHDHPADDEVDEFGDTGAPQVEQQEEPKPGYVKAALSQRFRCLLVKTAKEPA